MSDQKFESGPLIPVQRVTDRGRWVLVLTRPLAHPPARVWAALTDPEQLTHWAPFVPDRDLAAVGQVSLTLLDGADGSGNVAQPGWVLECLPPRVLVHTWGADLLRWELTGTADGEGTSLVLRHAFDDESMASSYAAGWHLCLFAAEASLAGTPIGPVIGKAAPRYGWVELDQRYGQLLDR